MKASPLRTPLRRATDQLPGAKVNPCAELADLACQVDALKFYFKGVALAELTLAVSNLHAIAMREAGPTVQRIYGVEMQEEA